MRISAMVKRVAVIGLIGSAVYLIVCIVKIHGSANSTSQDVIINMTGEYGGPWWTGSKGLLKDVVDRPLFYNRVPKCGSEMLVLLLKWLQAYNNFKHVSLPNGHLRQLNQENQADIVKEIRHDIQNEVVPVSFDRHVYFINFTQFGQEMVLYINLLRDPVEKIISRFFYHHIGFSKLYKKAFNISKEEWKIKFFEECVHRGESHCQFIPGQAYDLSIPYFCGQNPNCMVLNNAWALEEAKRNIEKYYVVVGVLELLNETMAVLEDKLPQFFSGMSHMFYSELMVPKMNKNLERPREVSEELRNLLKVNLSMEYELYEFAKTRLLIQYAEIKPKLNDGRFNHRHNF